MDETLAKRLDALEAKLDLIYVRADRTYKILYWTGIITVLAIVLPLVGLLFAIPSFLSYYSNIANISGGLQ